MPNKGNHRRHSAFLSLTFDWVFAHGGITWVTVILQCTYILMPYFPAKNCIDNKYFAILVHFHQWHSLFSYFLFSLSPLTKEELKRYESLECYNDFESTWVKEVKIKLLNYLLNLSWLLDGSVCKVFPSLFYCSILIRCIVHIAPAEIREREGSILPSGFYG